MLGIFFDGLYEWCAFRCHLLPEGVYIRLAGSNLFSQRVDPWAGVWILPQLRLQAFVEGQHLVESHRITDGLSLGCRDVDPIRSRNICDKDAKTLCVSRRTRIVPHR